MALDYISQSIAEIDCFQGRINCLLITATKIETDSLHEMFSPFPEFSGIIKVCHKSQTYYLGKFGSYGVVHVQCNMGGVDIGSSTHTVRDAFDIWEIKAVLMPGIAYGLDENRQNIGDVLVSEAVAHHDKKRVGRTETISRSSDMRACHLLLNRFKNITGWEFVLDSNVQPKIIPGLILSGESLIDNEGLRNQLKERFPAAKGGEMEGAGVASACINERVSWILVKSICDFADGNKSKNKKQNQKTAARSSVSLCHNVFSDKNSLINLGVFPFEDESIVDNKISTQGIDKKNFSILSNSKIVKDVLFDIYRDECESYYLKRELDKIIECILSTQGLWISGGSGLGKTCAIQRFFSIAKKKMIFVTLGAYNGYPVDSIINGLFCELKTILGPEQESYVTKLQTHQSIQKLVDLIGLHCGNNEAHILIEEIPIGDSNDFEAFIGYINALIINYKSRYPVSQLKFILSSISDPKPHIQEHQSKITENIFFHRVTDWNRDEIAGLLELITEAIKCELTDADFDCLIESANGSPRFIKQAIRNSIMFSNKTISDIVKMTK